MRPEQTEFLAWTYKVPAGALKFLHLFDLVLGQTFVIVLDLDIVFPETGLGCFLELDRGQVARREGQQFGVGRSDVLDEIGRVCVPGVDHTVIKLVLDQCAVSVAMGQSRARIGGLIDRSEYTYA